MTDPHEYNASADSYRSWAEAIKQMRLQGIRQGLYAPRSDNEEEMEASHDFQRQRAERE